MIVNEPSAVRDAIAPSRALFVERVSAALPDPPRDATSRASATVNVSDAAPEPEEISWPSASATVNVMDVEPEPGRPKPPVAAGVNDRPAKPARPPR